MKRLIALVLAAWGATASAQDRPGQEQPGQGRRVLELRDFGSFHVGGREVAVTGQPVRDVLLTPGGAPTRVDPNGTYIVEQMYVQYMLPARRRGIVPLLLWHGGGLTGVAYETTPDGRPGWLDAFVRRGWDTYVSDAVERGRAGFPPPGVFGGDPVFTPKQRPFEAFRIGPKGSYDEDPAARRPYPGSQFPVEAYDAFVRQQSPRWTTTDEAILRAYLAEIDRVCPCVILVHSQAGQFGFRAAQARPDKVKALVAVEPSGFGDPGRAAILGDVPTLVLYGDNIEQDPRWPTIRGNGLRWVAIQNAGGGQAEVIELPARGIRGNSHMMMMDRNNAQVAAIIDDWLRDKGLARPD